MLCVLAQASLVLSAAASKNTHNEVARAAAEEPKA